MFFKSCIALIFAAMLAVFSPLAAANSSTKDISLQLRWMHQFQSAGYYAALHKGFYREVGLNVTILEGQPHHSVVNRVLSGGADFGVSNSGGLLGSYLNGSDVVALAPIFQHSPSVLLVAGKHAVKIQDLAKSEKPIQIKSGLDDLELQAMFLSQGIALDSVNIIHEGPHIDGLILDKLAAINAYISNEILTLEDLGLPYTVLHPQTFGMDFYGDVLFTSLQTVNNQPDVVEKFRAASLRGWEYAATHKEEIVDIILKYYNTQNKTRDELLREADILIGLIRPEFVRVGYSNEDRWQHIADTLFKFNAVPNNRDLKDFLYQEPQRNYVWLRWVAGVMATLLFLISFRFLVLYNANKRLRSEIETRESIEHDLHAKQYQLERFSRIIDEHIMLLRVDLSENVLSVTRALLQKTGLDEADIKRHSVDKIFDNRHANLENFRNAFRSRLSWRGEARILRHEGTPFWADVSLVPTFNETGEVIEMAVFFVDITARKSIEEISRIDGLTGLLNRRTFLEEATRLIHATPSPWICVAMIDADFFKRINDTWGHLAGDRVLKAIAREITALHQSGAAVTGRFGGEEFLALFPCLDPLRPVAALHQFMQRIRALEIPCEDDGVIRLTMSIGLEGMRTADVTMDRLLHQADQALYQAKLNGRDRMCFGQNLQAEQMRRCTDYGDGWSACTVDNPWPAAKFRAQQNALENAQENPQENPKPSTDENPAQNPSA